MSEIQALAAQLPVAQIAKQAGVSESEAQQAIDAVLPALVGGMQANAQDPAGSASLASALGAHGGELQRRLAGDIDAADGQKIVDNVFGAQSGQIATALGGDGVLGQIIRKVLPIVAPIVLAWLAEKFLGNLGGGSSAKASAPAEAPSIPAQPADRDNPFANSGSSGQPRATPSRTPAKAPANQQAPAGEAGGLGDLLGGILGGSGGGLGEILGGLLGGGKR